MKNVSTYEESEGFLVFKILLVIALPIIADLLIALYLTGEINRSITVQTLVGAAQILGPMIGWLAETIGVLVGG